MGRVDGRGAAMGTSRGCWRIFFLCMQPVPAVRSELRVGCGVCLPAGCHRSPAVPKRLRGAPRHCRRVASTTAGWLSTTAARGALC